MVNRYRIDAFIILLVLLSACAPTRRIDRAPGTIDALPPVPERDGPLDINLVYPRSGAMKPNADSTFLFGSVGTGDAELSINGERVDVAPNGGFLAFIPVPADGTYRFTARADGVTDQFVFSYASPPARSPAVEAFEAPMRAVVVGGRDTLATGSQIVHAYPAPGADRRWFFPPGTELVATGRSEGLVRVRLTPETDAWIDSTSVRLGGAPAESRRLSAIDVTSSGRQVDLKLGTNRAPFIVIPEVSSVGIVVYGQGAPQEAPPPSDFIREASWRGSSPDSAYLHLELSEPLWGFKAFYDQNGALVVRLRRPPEIDPSNPLRGIRILVDPGHPPGGAIGPTAYTEAEANLAVSLKLADMLRQRGADVLMTRTTGSGLVSDTETATELWARVDMAVDEDADLLVSVHNNAFADGVNPFLNFGTETYYYHPFSAPLAESLQRELVKVTGLPSLGAKQRSLALVRPSWMPSTLTESLFMMFPQQEEALKNPGFQERLARAHLEGISNFLERLMK